MQRRVYGQDWQMNWESDRRALATTSGITDIDWTSERPMNEVTIAHEEMLCYQILVHNDHNSFQGKFVVGNLALSSSGN